MQTDDGPSDAWVYIDHRVNPGPPRPGYLERIIDGALHHGLPQRWIDFLRRWDPARWPRPRSRPTTPAPQSLSELLADPGVVEVSRLRSRFGFLAIHGGGLEQMTDVIAERAADAAGASVYLLRHPDRYPHHLSSARFPRDESARLAEFLDHVDVAVSLHGYGRIGRGHPTAGRRPQPRAGRPPGRPPRAARLSRRHRPRRDPARAARTTSAEPGQPDTRRRNTTGTADSGQGASARAVRCPAPTACRR